MREWGEETRTEGLLIARRDVLVLVTVGVWGKVLAGQRGCHSKGISLTLTLYCILQMGGREHGIVEPIIVTREDPLESRKRPFSDRGDERARTLSDVDPQQ